MFRIKKRVISRYVLRTALILCFIIGSAYILFFWNLGDLTPGYSPTEKNAIEQSSSLSAIAANPLFAPHKLLQLAISHAGESVFLSRLPSVLLAIIFIGSFYILVRRWFGRMVSVLGSIIFATLPWVILISRSAAPDVMYLSGVCLFASLVWLSITEKKALALLLVAACAVFIAYTPGMIWFLTIIGFLWRKKIGNELKAAGKLASSGAIALLVLGLVPLGWTAANNQDVLLTALLIPLDFPPVIELLKTTIWGGLSFVWATRESYPLVLGNLALLSISVVALSVFGIYVMWKRARVELIGFLALILIGIFGYGLNKNLAVLTIAFPSFGIFTAAGLRYLYAEWRSVFPLNPIPKTLALGLVIGLTLLNAAFGLRYALDAWPNTQATKNTYVLK